MITIALKDRTVEVISINIASVEGSAPFSLWATKKSDGKSFKIYESNDGAEIKEIKDMIDKTIELGEYLADLTKVGE